MLAFHIYLWCGAILYLLIAVDERLNFTTMENFRSIHPSPAGFTQMFGLRIWKPANTEVELGYSVTAPEANKRKEVNKWGGERQIKLPEYLTLKVQEVKSGKAEALVSWKFL